MIQNQSEKQRGRSRRNVKNAERKKGGARFPVQKLEALRSLISDRKSGLGSRPSKSLSLGRPAASGRTADQGRKVKIMQGARPGRGGRPKRDLAYGLAAAALLAVCLCAGGFYLGEGFRIFSDKTKVLKEAQAETTAELMAAEAAEGQEKEGEKQELYLSDAVAGGAGSQAEGQAVSGDGKPQIDQLDSALTTSNGFADTEDLVTVQENGVNLRAESQTGSRIITQLQAGEVLERTGKNEEWSRVLYDGRTCYVASQYVKVQEPEKIVQEPVPEADAPQERAVPADAAVMAASDGTVIPVSNGRIVVLDAGHQGKENTSKEPAGPDSFSQRQKMPAGAVGNSLGLRECDVTLSIARKAKQILTERGYTVIMTRESNDINLSCAERAEIANRSGAGALVHIHTHSQESTSVSGILATCQSSGNPYNSGIYGRSYALSRSISGSVSQATGARNRGVQQTDTLSEINWSQVPVTVLEVGFLSNQQEELLLSQEEYQDRIALGIADGLDQFFSSGE